MKCVNCLDKIDRAAAKSLCWPCYQYKRRNGKHRIRKATVREKLAGFTRQSNECMIWTGTLTKNGHPRFSGKGHGQMARRAMYEEYVGPLAPKVQLTSSCGNRLCVAPDHLVYRRTKKTQKPQTQPQVFSISRPVILAEGQTQEQLSIP